MYLISAKGEKKNNNSFIHWQFQCFSNELYDSRRGLRTDGFYPHKKYNLRVSGVPFELSIAIFNVHHYWTMGKFVTFHRESTFIY